MPQRKTAQEFFGIHYALALHTEIKKFVSHHPGVFRGVEEFKVIVRLATQQLGFANLSYNKKRLIDFGLIYGRDPDGVLKLMILVRKILEKWRKTEAGKAKIFLLTNRSVAIDRRKPVYDADGNCTAVVAESLLDDTERTFPAAKLSREEVNRLMFPKYVSVGSLLDKEIATLLGVNSESIKKARQSVSRDDKKIAFWENPEVVRYMQTGVTTPELKRIRKNLLKGKGH